MPVFLLTAFVFFFSPAGAGPADSSGGGSLPLSKLSLLSIDEEELLKQENGGPEETKKWDLGWSSSLTR